jgi:hypothetical protein
MEVVMNTKWLLVMFVFVSVTLQAQHFVFVSDRGLQSFQANEEGRFPVQNDLFIYRDGSEIRLTRTTDQSEYDPSPSPDSQLLAYAVTHVNHYDETRSWSYRVIDLPLGREVASFDIARSTGETRPAGGFQITWLDNTQFLAQVWGSGNHWEIHRFTLDNAESEFVTHGFGIALSPDKQRLVTEFNEMVKVVDLETGEHTLQAAASPLAWYNDTHIFVTRPDSLMLLDTDSQSLNQMASYLGWYYDLRVSPDQTHYAYVSEYEDTWYVTIVNRNHEEVAERSFISYVTGLEWLTSDQLILTLYEGERSKLVVLDFLGNAPYLVDSAGYDYSARALHR